MGILHVQLLDWVAISFSRGSSQPRDWTYISCIDHTHTRIHSPPNSPPGCHIALSRVSCVVQKDLGGYHFKNRSVYMSISNSLTIPSPLATTSSFFKRQTFIWNWDLPLTSWVNLGELLSLEEGDRVWDGWMASPTQWTWIWAISGRWCRTERPGALQSMGVTKSQKWLSDWTTKQL